jgi:hypothetical protein
MTPLDQMVLQLCAHWLTREELVLELRTAAAPQDVESTIDSLLHRSLLQRMTVAKIANGQTIYSTTALAKRKMRAQNRRLTYALPRLHLV